METPPQVRDLMLSRHRLVHEKSFATLIMYLGGQDPCEVTQVLGVSPESAWTAGGEVLAGNYRNNTVPQHLRGVGACWAAQTTLREDLPLDAHLLQLADLCEPHAPYISGLIDNGAYIWIQSFVYVQSLMGGTVFSAEALARIGALRIDLSLELLALEERPSDDLEYE